MLAEITRCPAPYVQNERVTLYHANCCDVISYLRGVDYVVTEPGHYLSDYIKQTEASGTVRHQDEVDWYAKQWLFFASWMTQLQGIGVQNGLFYVQAPWLPVFLRLCTVIQWSVQTVTCVKGQYAVQIGSLPNMWGLTVVDPFSRTGDYLELAMTDGAKHVIGIDANLERIQRAQQQLTHDAPV